LSICVARLKRGEGDEARLRSAIQKIKIAAQWALCHTAGDRIRVVSTAGSDLGPLRCSFCQTSELEVRLTPSSAPGISICDDCVDICRIDAAEHKKLLDEVTPFLHKELLFGSPQDVAPAVLKAFPRAARIIASHLRRWANKPTLAPDGLDFSSERAEANLVELADLLEKAPPRGE